MKLQPVAAATAAVREKGGRLRFGEQFVIWSMRVWAQAHNGAAGQSHHHLEMLRKAFGLAGVTDGDLLFDRMMTSVVISRHQGLDLHFPACRGVSSDEIRVLRLVGEAQRGTLTDEAVGGIVARAGIGPVRDACRAFAAALAASGMTVRPLEPAEQQDGESVRQAVETAPPGRTVH